jgi:hypothetical protein
MNLIINHIYIFMIGKFKKVATVMEKLIRNKYLETLIFQRMVYLLFILLREES